MDNPLLTGKSAKGIIRKRTTAAVLVMAFIAVGALVSMSAQQIGVATPSVSTSVNMFARVLPGGAGGSTRLSRNAPAQRLGTIANVRKKTEVVVTRDDAVAGKTAGDITIVAAGYARNWLLPRGLAKPVTQEILDKIAADKQAELDRLAKIKADAVAIQGALKTIGKFTIKKKVGEESKIFGSVTPADIVEAIAAMTGKELDKKEVTIPDISELGTYDASIRLHPEVKGEFKVAIVKDNS
jgi:large subunit ribosomal protein L9